MLLSLYVYNLFLIYPLSLSFTHSYVSIGGKMVQVDAIDMMIRDQFANYVLQRMVDVVDDDLVR